MNSIQEIKDVNSDWVNLIVCLQELFEGKILTLSNGQRIGMGEDFIIGYIFDFGEGEGISTFSETFDLKDLNKLLKKENITILKVK